MRKLIILIMGIFLLIIGCSEEKKTVQEYGTTVIKQADRARDVQSQAQLQVLKSAIASFKTMEGRNPQSLEELQEKKFIKQLPAPQPGKRYFYDAGTGEVRLEG